MNHQKKINLFHFFYCDKEFFFSFNEFLSIIKYYIPKVKKPVSKYRVYAVKYNQISRNVIKFDSGIQYILNISITVKTYYSHYINNCYTVLFFVYSVFLLFILYYSMTCTFFYKETETVICLTMYRSAIKRI